jgi:hypothetical protein
MNITLIVNSSKDNWKNIDKFLKYAHENIIVITNCGYKNENAEIMQYDFEYWNQAFLYFCSNYDKEIEYISFLDDDDYMDHDKIDYILYKYGTFDYFHNRADYHKFGKRVPYEFTSILHNNSSISMRYSLIIPELFNGTTSLSDFLLYLSVYGDNRLIKSTDEVLTRIGLKEYTKKDYIAYYIDRAHRRFDDLVYIYNNINLPLYKQQYVYMELIKYRMKLGYKFNISVFISIIKNVKIRNMINKDFVFAVLNYGKSIEWYAEREYTKLDFK